MLKNLDFLLSYYYGSMFFVSFEDVLSDLDIVF